MIQRYWRCDIHGATNGKLHGKTIAIKDNVCVAGVPMMDGSRILEGFVPDVDATVVSRILEAGGRILGKAVCENLCFDGASFTSATGPVLNPYDQTIMAGGSSSGSAALVRSANLHDSVTFSPLPLSEEMYILLDSSTRPTWHFTP